MSVVIPGPRPRTRPGRAERGPGRLAEGLAWSLAALVLAAAVAGLLVDDVYTGAASTAAMLRAYDLVSVVLVVPSLTLATVRARRGSVTSRLTVAGLAAYVVYTYAFYLFGTGFNDLFLLHTAVFGTALWLLVLTLGEVDGADLAGRSGSQKRPRATAGILALLAVALGGMWVYHAADNAVTNEIPAGSQLVETSLVVHLGMALDLALLVPLYAAAAVLVWRRHAWGYVLAVLALLPGILHQVSYLVAMPFQVAEDVPGAVTTDPAEPIIVLLYVGATALLLGGARDATDEAQGVVSRWLAPQDYSADTRYRAPSRGYGRLSRWIGVPLTTLGLAPRHAVALEVTGRRSGRTRRNPVLVTRFRGEEYLVSLAGESDWVRNVRAARGRAVLHRKGARPVRLVEVPPTERAPVLAAYQAAGTARSGESAGRVQARLNFGLSTDPAPGDFEQIAHRYPVFRVHDAPRQD